MKKIGLTLTGGGAHAAYQVGVLKAVSQICGCKESPFKIISGLSAGAINGIWLAVLSEDFESATHAMWNEWSELQMHQVFRTDSLSLLGIGSRWIKDLSFGGWLGKSKVTHLLDSSPLRQLLAAKVDFEKLERHFKSGLIHGIAVSSTNYHSGNSVTFFNGHASIEPWQRGIRSGRRTRLNSDHIISSAAIPVFFPPVRLEDGYYGDGGVSLRTPLSPAIHMGADRIFAIGIRHSSRQKPPHHHSISMGDIVGTLLNSLFLGSLDSDVERLERVNRTVSIMTPDQLKHESDHLHGIPILAIQPSKDLGALASNHLKLFPTTLRHLLRGMGITDKKGWDLLSYLAFDKSYINTLLNLGFEDAQAQKHQILEFLRAD